VKPINAHSFERHEHEWYVEPRDVNAALFRVEDMPSGVVYDPCCGEGRILDAAASFGYLTLGADIVDRGCAHFFERGDLFFTDHERAHGACLVSNPPYKDVGFVVRHLVDLLRHRRIEKLCLLLGAGFHFSARRTHWFLNNPPERIHALIPRPSMPPGDYVGAVEGGKRDYAWYVWTPMSLMLCSPPRVHLMPWKNYAAPSA